MVLLICERLWPYRSGDFGTAKETARDFFFFATSAPANGLGRAGAVALATYLAAGQAGHGLPLWFEVILAVYTAEFFAYWFHRLSHRPGFLWRVHSMHHLPDKVNLTNNFLMHPINIIGLKFLRMSPLLLLGFSAEAVFIHGLLAIGIAMTTHANTGGSLGILNYFIGTRELHRYHHSLDVREAGNHGTVVPLWDQLFGTLYYAHSGPVAVGVKERQTYPRSIWGMLVFPVMHKDVLKSRSPRMDESD